MPTPLTPPASRLRLATPALTLAALLTVAGCSSPESDAGTTSGGRTSAGDASTSATDLLPEGEGTTTYPLTVSTALGDLVVEERPGRVVMASSWDGDLFAALGVTPVATDGQISFFPWVTDALPEQIETTWPVEEDELYPAETIATTSPDLIVDTLAADPSTVEKIEDVAPVLGAPEANGENSTWQERILLLGEVLDLSDRAQQVIDDYDASFATIRAEHPEFAGKTVDYVAFYGAEYGGSLLNVEGSDAEAMFTRLGFAPNPNAANTAFEDGMSDELVGTLAGDVLVVSDQEPEAFKTYSSSPLFQGLRSVQDGKVVVLQVDTSDWSVSHDGEPTDFHGHFGRAFNYGPIAHQEIADLLVPLLVQTLQE